jgi:hypothetical protein
MGNQAVRRVVTGFDADGRAVITHDGEAPNAISAGPVGVSEVYWSDGPTVTAADDPDRSSSEGFPLEPPPGGMSARVIRMPGAPPAAPPTTPGSGSTSRSPTRRGCTPPTPST